MAWGSIVRIVRTWLSRLADQALRTRRDRRLRDEVQLHLELLAEDLEQRGWPRDRARTEARRRFGGVDQMTARYRDARGLPLIDAVRQDVRFGLRLFARDRSLSLSIVAALALGIGATVTVFTILNAMLLRDVPFFRDPDRVMALDSMDARGRQVGVSFDDYLDWRTATSFSGMAAYAGSSAILADGDRPADRLNGVFVSAGTFELLGAAPAIGRAFRPDDDRPGAAMVVVLAHGLWAGRFGSDPEIIGRQIRVNGASATVVGVMPPGFSFPLTGDLWVPLAHMPGVAEGARDRRVLTLVGRLGNGISLAQARAELETLCEGLAARHTATNAGVRPVIVPFVSRYLGTFTTPEPLLLLTAVIVLLLIACATASTLLLTRAAGRAREIALRATIGASRARIVGQLLVESVLLAAVSGLCGLALAAGAVRAFASTTGELGLPAWTRFQLDTRVFVFSALVCLGTGLVFGCAPALHLSGRATPLALKDGGRGLAGATRPGLWMRVLLAAQVALALILLAGATNLVFRARALYAADQVTEPARVLAARLALPATRLSDGAARERLVVDLHGRLRAVPGVVAAAVSTTLPFVGAGTARMHLEGTEGAAADGPSVCTVGIAGDYLSTLKLRVLAGRPPAPGEPDAAVVNEAFANTFARDTTPVGRRLRLARAGSGGVESVLTIVGVVSSVRQTPIGDARPCVYVPLADEPGPNLAVMLRTAGAPAASAPALRAALQALDPDLALYSVHRLDELSHIVRWSTRTISVVLSAFGLIAFVLSIGGLYAVTARGVAQRAQEIGVHLALGARQHDIWRLVAGRAAPVVAGGLLLGTAGGMGVTRAMRGLLIGPDGAGRWCWRGSHWRCSASPCWRVQCRSGARCASIRVRRCGWTDATIRMSMKGHTCYHCKQWVEEGEAHDCWTTTEAALTADLSEALREAWERLRDAASALGEQRIYASHSSIMFSRRSCYFFVRPKRSFLELNVFLGRAIQAPQVRKVVRSSVAKIVHVIQIRHRDEVEPPITDWLAEAFEYCEAAPRAVAKRAKPTPTRKRASGTAKARKKGSRL